MILQILDVNYINSNIDGSPIIQLFCINEFGIDKVIKVLGFRSYFYALSSDLSGTKEHLDELYLQHEDVDRFKPIGYQSKPSKMLKIYTNSPRDVREMREKVRNIPNVSDIFEADVLFHDRFSADTGISCLQWIEVESEEVHYKDIKIIEPQEEIPLRILSLDIECLIPESGSVPLPENDQITLISLAFSHGYNGINNLVLIAKKISCDRSDILSYNNEYEMLKALINIIKDYNPDIITGYNVEGFDLNYIDIRNKKHRLSCNIGRDNSSMYLHKFGTSTEVQIAGRIVIDTLPMIRRNYSLKQYTLKNVSSELLHLQKLDVPASKMREFWLDNGENFINFIKYSRRDAVLGLMLLTNLGLLRKHIALSKASGILLQTVVRGGQTQMLEFMILRRFNQANRVVNMKPEVKESNESGFEGAYVSKPKKNLCDNLLLTDMQSLYPSLIIRYNLCPTTMILEEEHKDFSVSPEGTKFVNSIRGILPEMLDELLKKRLDVKSRMKKAIDLNERDILDSIQYSYKILLNSAYGLCGYPRSRTFASHVASSVTAYGRETIKGVRDSIESIKYLEVNNKKVNFEVIYTDTDSAYVEVLCQDNIDPDEADIIGNKLTKIVSEPMSYPMKLNYEGYASRALFLTKKRYAMCMTTKKDNVIKHKIKVKGIEVVRRDWCQLTGETMSKVLEIILIEGNPYKAWEYANSIVQQVISLTDIRNNLELANKLILSRKIGNLESYKNEQAHVTVCKKMIARGEQPFGLGERCQYLALPGATRDGISTSVDTMDYIISTNGRIDNHWYVEKQIIPPLERVFSSIGIDIITGKKKLVENNLFEFKESDKKPVVVAKKQTKTGLFAFS
jgi:DNA polymerase I